MTKEFLETVKDYAGEHYRAFLQNRLEEAKHYHDLEAVRLVGNELVSSMEELYGLDMDESTRKMIDAEIGYVRGDIEEEDYDAGSGYLLDDSFLDGLDEKQLEDAAWQMYILSRMAEADDEGDAANYMFLTGKYADELKKAYGDVDEVAENIDLFKDAVKNIKNMPEFAEFEKGKKEIEGYDKAPDYVKIALFAYENPEIFSQE